MRYLTLRNGVQIPIIGYGTAGLKGEQAYSCVKEAIQLGYRMIDTAHMYGNEKEVGRAIKDSQIPRNELFIVSKMDSRSNSYSKAKNQIEKSLLDLDLSYIDLYLIHEPYDESNEMWKALEEAYNNGILKSIGISNFFGKRFTEFIRNCKILPMVNQLETHIYLQRKQDQRILNEKGIVLMSWSPLTGGKDDFYNDPILSEIGKKIQQNSCTNCPEIFHF